MKTLKGIGASRGVVSGRVVFYSADNARVSNTVIEDTDEELRRFAEAQKTAVEQIDELYRSAIETVGESAAQIFDIHKMMVEADEFVDAVKELITEEKCCAPYAVQQAGESLASMFRSMDDEYMKERSADVTDISSRIVKILMGVDNGKLRFDQPCILAADDLLPSDTIRFDCTNILAFLTREGSQTSHLSILARIRGIPAVVGMGGDYNELSGGSFVLVDGAVGEVVIDPDEKTEEAFAVKKKSYDEYLDRLNKLKNVKSKTIDGTEVEICANIGGVGDINAVLDNDADGIGLLRSEFLYMESADMPSEDYLYDAYRQVVSKMGGKRVIIRTLDIGADKNLPYLDLGTEENPAIGYRAIRICLNNEPLFRTQLRAILRASAFGKAAIMFPMIAQTDEFVRSRKTVLECMEELRQEGIEFDENIPIGMMIEIPSAAILSREFAKLADFFSIGTNDLTQFTLAADRLNPRVDYLFNGADPAVLELISMTAHSAMDNGIMCGICGELGADTTLTEAFLRMGVRELSVSPNKVLEVREKVLGIDLS